MLVTLEESGIRFSLLTSDIQDVFLARFALSEISILLADYKIFCCRKVTISSMSMKNKSWSQSSLVLSSNQMKNYASMRYLLVLVLIGAAYVFITRKQNPELV